MSKRRRQRAAEVAKRAEPMPRIGQKGPPVGEVLPKTSARIALVDYRARDANPQDWFSVMTRADTGDTGPMIDLFSDARGRDSHLDGVISKRVGSMMGRPIVFRPPDFAEGDAEATDIAKRVTRILLSESQKFRAMLAHLMTGAAYGYSVARLDWTTNRRGEYVPHLGEVHPNRFAFDRDTLQLGFYTTPYRTSYKVSPLAEYPDAFVAHVPIGGRSDYPWRRGPVRSCIIPSFIKRNGLQFWLTLAERFGMPQPYATVPAGADHDGKSSDDTVATVQEALQNLGRYWSMVVTEGVEIDSVPGAGNVSADVHRGLIDWADTTQSIALLGQNLTTKVEGGSFAATDAHRAVAADIHLADAVELAETITQQVVEPLVRYNWPGAPVPICQISTGQRQTPTVEMVSAGIFSADEMRREMGFDAKSPTDERVPEIATTPTEGAAPQAGEVIETAPPAEDVAVVKDPATSLNGAQVDALMTIVTNVASGQIPRATGVALIVASFPLSTAQAEEIMGDVGRGFVPRPLDAPPTPTPTPAPAPAPVQP